MMRTEIVVALLAGLFGLAPIMLQVATARAQRKDKSPAQQPAGRAGVPRTVEHAAGAPFARRALLIYTPETLVGWALHTHFYVLAFMLTATILLGALFVPLDPGETMVEELLSSLLVWGIIFGTPLLIIQRLARRYGDRPEAAASP